MVQEMVITLREGGETSLILALLFSSLKAARHVAYRAAAWIGFALALALSVVAGIFLHDLGALGPLFEGSLAWIGAGFIASLAIQLHLNSVDYRGQLKALRESASAERASWATSLAIGTFAFVSVIREGLETAVFLANGAALRSEGSWMGAVVGLGLATALGISVYYGFRKLDIRAFMRTTEILLFALVLSLFVSGLHEFAEAGLVALPRPLALFHLVWIQGGLFLQILLCAAPFLYVVLARRPARDYLRAAAIALALAAIPLTLGAAARQWEHARLPRADRLAAATLEQRVHARSSEMLGALARLRDRVRAEDVEGARNAWIDARHPFVQLEPLLAKVNPETTEELNGEPGEPGEAAGFHGVEVLLFAEGAAWTRDARLKRTLVGDVDELSTRSRAALASLEALTLAPETVRDAWIGHRWTLAGRIDGQESASSQTSISEWGATLDAMDEDLGRDGHYSAPVREVFAPALKLSTQAPRHGEARAETKTSPELLTVAIPLTGPDRVWDGIDRSRLQTAVTESFARIESQAPAFSSAKAR
ncbi:MAG: FTR1 family protein [Candidatus Eiseniibacteriota bacterium]